MAQVTQLYPHGLPGGARSFSPKDEAGLVALNLRLKFGTVVLLATGDLTPPTTATDTPWFLDALFVVRSIGASGSVMPSGDYDNGQTKGRLSQAAAVTVDTTAAADVQVSVEMGTADPANDVTVQNLDITQVG